jgi:predicted DNA-binding protein (MmcQ/YjbR family)
MQPDDVRSFCLSLPHSSEETPFGPEALVYKVAGKMFALLMPDDMPSRLNLKCEPDYALELRDRHDAIRPGYHMNKRHWNTLTLDGSLNSRLVRELIRHSYDRVIDGLPARLRQEVRDKEG